MEKEPTLITRIFKKIQIIFCATVLITTFVVNCSIIIDKISTYLSDPVTSPTVPILSQDDEEQEVTVPLGKTMKLSKNSLCIITINNISKIDETGIYGINGILNNGPLTCKIKDKIQGESIIFDSYTIQIMKVASDYVEFRIIKKNN